jgi:multiple inositol-polyphosphate phosphatase/2,3-bisphosphoglycerate 3-phosphatase
VNRELTEYHAICEGHLENQGIEFGKHPQYTKFAKSPAMQNLIQSVSRRLGFDRTLSASELKMMFKGCSFGHAIHTDSSWCSVFSKQELRLIELHEDLDDYFADAYGRTINQRSPCPVVEDLVSRIQNAIARRDLSTRTFLRFSHAGAVKPLVSYFGLFDQLDTELPASSSSCSEREEWDSRSRVWRSSLIAPFSANIQFILYNCTSNAASNGNSGSGIDYRLLSLLQESPVTVRGCDSELCPVDQFLAQYRSAHQCDLEKICRL